MPPETLTETIKRELPGLLRQDPELRRYVLDLTRGLYADRVQTEDRFDRILDELRRDREAQTRKWEEYSRDQNLKWEESRQEFAAVHEEIMAQARKRSFDRLGHGFGGHYTACCRRQSPAIQGLSGCAGAVGHLLAVACAPSRQS